VASVLPAASVARTWNVCDAFESPVYACGLVQLAKAAPSSEHWKVLGVSDELNVKLALALVLGFAGLDVMFVSGAIESTTHVSDAGVASVFPAASVARTWKVCEPCARPV
jgi:hypothetical protein